MDLKIVIGVLGSIRHREYAVYFDNYGVFVF